MKQIETDYLIVGTGAVGTAFADVLLTETDADAPKVVGLTSSGNVAFVESLDLYDEVLPYDDLAQLDATLTAIVDMSSNATMIDRLHAHLGDAMRQTLDVGLTLWEAPRRDEDRIREGSTFFFAPSHIQARIKEWGGEEFARRTQTFMTDAIENSRGWLTVERLDGLQALADLHPAMAAGRIDPARGIIILVEN